MRLTEAQKRALSHLAKYPGEWRNDTPVTQKSLNVLKDRGLIMVAYDPKMGWCEKIIEKGIEEISVPNKARAK